jgi:hypothetical protein
MVWLAVFAVISLVPCVLFAGAVIFAFLRRQ